MDNENGDDKDDWYERVVAKVQELSGAHLFLTVNEGEPLLTLWEFRETGDVTLPDDQRDGRRAYACVPVAILSKEAMYNVAWIRFAGFDPHGYPPRSDHPRTKDIEAYKAGVLVREGKDKEGKHATTYVGPSLTIHKDY